MPDNPVLQAAKRRKTGLRKFLSEFASGMAGNIGPDVAEQFGHPELQNLNMNELKMFLEQPKEEAQTMELKARAQQRLNIPGKETEDFKIFQQAVRNVEVNPMVKFGVINPLERNQLINEEFEILKAGRKGQIAPSVSGNPKTTDFKNPDEVKAAVQSRAITKDQALNILNTKFKSNFK